MLHLPLEIANEHDLRVVGPIWYYLFRYGTLAYCVSQHSHSCREIMTKIMTMDFITL
jgi:hypothetical protein